MSLPSNAFYPLFPIQQTIYDKDTGFALAAGTVRFFSDIARSVPKDVYQRTENPDNTFTYTSLGYILQLSSIGTFVDNSGNNITVFLYPFTGLPTDSPQSTIVDLYYVIVESAGGTDQFTVSAWPPEVEGASSTVNQVLSSTNIVSNPQFAVVNYPSPYTFTVSGNTTTQIAPDWNVITSAAGSFTITQDPNVDPSATGAPAFALRISTSGIAATLSQTVSMSPRILENGFAAGTFIVKSNIMTTAIVDMNYVPSNPALTTKTICTTTAVNGSYTPAYGTKDLTDLTINPDDGDTGYVNIQLTIPIGADVSISCVQLISVPSETITPAYIQDPTTRQIDHLYHDAYPIVPVGTIIDYFGFNAPAHYLLCDGTTTYSRQTYNLLFSALTLAQSITVTSTTQFTTDATKLGIGMFVEGTNIPATVKITGISAYAPGATVTVSPSFTATGTLTATFFAGTVGQGDGSTTFTTPNLLGQVIAGTGGTSLFLAGTPPNTLGAFTGSATSTALVNHTHTQMGYSAPGGTLGLSASAGSATLVAAGQSGSQGTGTSFSLVQPTVFAYKYIRYE